MGELYTTQQLEYSIVGVDLQGLYEIVKVKKA